MSHTDPIRLIVNADDFGASEPVNAAVEQAFQSGVLTTASLMTGGRGFEQAVEIAKRNPRLGVGLHLTLVNGLTLSRPEDISELADPYGNLPENAIASGIRFFFDRTLFSQLEREIEAQFENFQQTGLNLDHVNGHLHFHLHPTIVSILRKHAARFGMNRFRLVREPLLQNLKQNTGHLFSKLFHWAIFQILSSRAQNRLTAGQSKSTSRTFGLLETGRMDEKYFDHVIRTLPSGTSEIYFHPNGSGPGKEELDALLSPRIREAIKKRDIRLIRYSDL